MRLVGRTVITGVLVGAAALAAAGPDRVAPVSAQLEISLRAASEGLEPAAVRLLVEPIGGAGDDREQPRRVTGRVPGRVRLTVPTSTAWKIEPEADHLWSPAGTVYVAAEGAGTTFTFWPTGELIGTIVAPVGESPPEELSVRFESSPPGRGAPPAVAAVPVATESCSVAERRFRCRVPAGTLDLRLRSPGHVSHYLWALSLGAGETRDLGALAMRRGASVSGWVEIDGPGEPSDVQASLLPGIGGQGTRDRASADRRALTTTATERGFFHLEGVPPGRHELSAALDGYAAARRSIEVLDRSEAVVREPLVLHPPLDLEVRLEPPRDPWDRPWNVRLQQVSESRASIEQSWPLEPAGDDGTWVKPGLPAGRYALRVGTPEHSLQAVDLELEPGQGPVMVEIPLIWVAGVVRRGDEPLAARLIFGGRHRPVSVVLESDAGGRFAGPLPRSGRWRVDVEAEQPSVRRTIRVEVPEPEDGESEAEIEIEIPDTVLAGTAVTESGQPVASAVVTVSRRTIPPESGLQVSTDTDGRFEFAGLPAGLVAIRGESRELSSGQALVFVTEDRQSPPVRLVLRERRRLAGRVESAAGPVPGVGLHFFPVGTEMTAYNATTGADGEFEVSLPASADDVQVIAMAPGFALSTSRSAVDGRALRIALGQDGGTLVLEGPGDPERLEDAGRAPLVLHRGSFLTLDLLFRWALLNGADPADPALRVPMMEPGDYTLCIGGWGDLQRSVRGQNGSAARCTGGYLPPGGELRLAAAPIDSAGAGSGD